MMRTISTQAFLKRTRAQQGMTLIEMAVVLGVISLIIAAIWVVAANVNENARQYNFTSNLQQVVQNVRQLYQRVNVVDHNSDVTGEVDAQEGFPQYMRISNAVADVGTTTNIHHPWSSLTSVQVITYNPVPVSATAPAPQGFAVRVFLMPRQACITALVKQTGGDAQGLVGVRVNGNDNAAFPISVVTAGALCGNAAATNDMFFYFTLRS